MRLPPQSRTHVVYLGYLFLLVCTFTLGNTASAFTIDDWKDFWGKSDEDRDSWGSKGDNYRFYLGVQGSHFKWNKPKAVNREDEDALRSQAPDVVTRPRVDDNGVGIGIVLGGEWRLTPQLDLSPDKDVFVGVRGGLGTFPDMQSRNDLDFNGGHNRISTSYDFSGKRRIELEMNGRVQFARNFSAGAFLGYNHYRVHLDSMADFKTWQPNGQYTTIDSLSDSKGISDGSFAYGLDIGFRLGGNTPQDPNPFYVRARWGMSDFKGHDVTFFSLALEKYLGGYKHRSFGP